MFLPRRILRVRHIRLHYLRALIRVWPYLSKLHQEALIKAAYMLQSKLEMPQLVE